MRTLSRLLPRFPEIPALFAILLIDLVWMRSVHLAFASSGLVLAATLGLLLLALVYGHAGRSTRISDMAYYGGLCMACGSLMISMSYLAAYRGSALYDATLAQVDAAMGFDWLRWAAFVRAHPLFDLVLGLAYASLLPQIALTILALAHMGRQDRNKEFFWTVFVSSLATLVVFRLFPAAGPFAFYHIDLGRAVHLKDLLELRSGAVHAYPLPQLQGLIAFPSYHTVLAVLFPYVHRHRRSFLPVLALNLLMLVSTPSHGGHYLTDVIGGLCVALGSIALVRYGITRAQGRRDPVPGILEEAVS
jgi:hypothetical protein